MVEKKYRPHPAVELCHAPLRNVFHSHTHSSTIFVFFLAFPGTAHLSWLYKIGETS